MDAADLVPIPLFASLSQRQRQELARKMDVVDLPAGRVLTDEGVLAYEFLVIVDGTATVSHGSRHIRNLGAGDFIGEIGLLQDQQRRTATVVTTSPVRALVMSGPEFRALVRDQPEIADAVRATMQQRIAADADSG